MGHHRSITGNHIGAVDEKTLARHGQARQRSGVVRRHRTPGHVFEHGFTQAQQGHCPQHAGTHDLVNQGIGGLMQFGLALLRTLHRQPVGDNFHRQPGRQHSGKQHHGYAPPARRIAAQHLVQQRGNAGTRAFHPYRHRFLRLGTAGVHWNGSSFITRFPQNAARLKALQHMCCLPLTPTAPCFSKRGVDVGVHFVHGHGAPKQVSLEPITPVQTQKP